MKEPITQRERNENDPQRPSQLFLLRVWIDRKRDSQASEDWAGKVQDPVSGQVQYFSGGMELVRVLRHLISRKEKAGAAGPADNDKPDAAAPKPRT